MAMGGHFGWPKLTITFLTISDQPQLFLQIYTKSLLINFFSHFRSIHNFFVIIFFTKLAPAAIFHLSKSILINWAIDLNWQDIWMPKNHFLFVLPCTTFIWDFLGFCQSFTKWFIISPVISQLYHLQDNKQKPDNQQVKNSILIFCFSSIIISIQKTILFWCKLKYCHILYSTFNLLYTNIHFSQRN